MRIFFLALLALVLTACGGSGESSNSAPSAISNLRLTFSEIKGFHFRWNDVDDATYYTLWENEDGNSGYIQVSGQIEPSRTGYDDPYTFTAPIYQLADAQYFVQSCNTYGCTDSDIISVDSSINEAIGYIKASNPDVLDNFGSRLVLSSDGSTLAVSALSEDSNATGIDGDQADNSTANSGAVYVFTKNSDDIWSQQAYLKASNTGDENVFGTSLSLSSDGSILAVSSPNEDSYSKTDSGAVYIFNRDSNDTWSQQAYLTASNNDTSDYFGKKVALSSDGYTLAVGATGEDSDAVNVDGDESNNSVGNSGAVYIFTRDYNNSWSQQSYIKASNTGVSDAFGISLALSKDGDTLAIGANGEDSNATGIDGDESNDSLAQSGAVYVFTRDSNKVWSKQSYLKASNAGGSDGFGSAIALSTDGNTLAIGATSEDSNATNINGSESNNSEAESGAVYVYVRDTSSTWSQQAYVKASNTESFDYFGQSLSLSEDGDILAVGAYGESSNATGLEGDQLNNNATSSGAVYTFIRNNNVWAQRSYVKASNTGEYNFFGYSLSLSSSGNTLAVGAYSEDGSSAGVSGSQTNLSTNYSGAVYLY